MTITEIIILILIGLFTGVVTGMTGSSGVIVVVPLLNMVMNFTVHESIGTSLMVDIIAPLAIAYKYYKHGNIDLKSGVWIAMGSIVGAQLGALFSAGIPDTGLGGFFGIYLTIMGITIWKRGINRKAIVEKFRNVIKFDTNLQKITTSLILGFLIGIITGLLGAGGGIMILLILIFVLDFPLHSAVGTSILIMAITAASGTIGYALEGSVKPIAGAVIGLSAVIGGLSSAQYANEINENILAKSIGIVFAILGLIMTAIRGIQIVTSL